MRARMLALLAAMLVTGAGCGTDTDTAASPAPDGTPAPLSEVRLEECVIDQGTLAPATATGDDVTTMRDGVLTVGSDTSFPPFESIEDGVPVGFDVDLITEIAERLDLRAEIQSANFDTIFTALASGRFDVVISAVTIKEERKQTVDFTDPYFNADQSLTIREADVGEIGGVEDVSGLTVGVQQGTTGEDCANNALKAKDRVEDVRSYETAPDAFTDLAANRVDAVLVDLPTAQQIVEDRKGLVLIEVIRTDEEYGIAVDKKNPNLREAINKTLAEIRDDGTYEELYRKWFDTDPPEGD